MDWLNGLLSASFSVARCSRPTCGSAFWMTSPSSSSTRRSTPCAAGCCGPKFSVKFWISGTAGILQFEVGLVTRVVADDLRHERARLDADGLVDDAALHRVVAHFDVADQREILAERVADETVVRQQAAQVRMAAEQDSIEIERLALEPIGGVPDFVNGIDDRPLVARAERLEPQPVIVRDRQQVIDDGEPRRRDVGRVLDVLHGRRGAQRSAAEAGAGRAARLPLVLAVGLIVDAADVDQYLELQLRLVAQRAADIEQVVGRHAIAELTRRRRQTLDARAELRFDRAR